MAVRKAFRSLAVVATVGSIVVLPHASAFAASTAVSIKDYQFQAEVVTVSVGDTVKWTNKDLASNSVQTSKAPVAFGSKLLRQGDSFSYKFTKAGTYQYFCGPHPNMVAKVVVK